MNGETFYKTPYRTAKAVYEGRCVLNPRDAKYGHKYLLVNGEPDICSYCKRPYDGYAFNDVNAQGMRVIATGEPVAPGAKDKEEEYRDIVDKHERVIDRLITVQENQQRAIKELQEIYLNVKKENARLGQKVKELEDKLDYLHQRVRVPRSYNSRRVYQGVEKEHYYDPREKMIRRNTWDAEMLAWKKKDY